MKLNIILILMSVRFLGYAQEPIFFVGFETGGWVVSRVNPSTKESLFAYNLNTEPRIGVLLKDKYALGIHYSYGVTRGDSINQVNYPDIHGAGVLGFSYWFQKGNKEKPLHLFKNIRRNSSPSFISHFGERLIVGSSYTYIPNESSFDKRIKHHEFTLNVDAALNLNSRWYLGLSYKDIRTKGSTISKYKDKKENYYIVGLFTQYDFLHQNKYRLFAHVSGNYGNYCTCGDEDPYKVEGLHYLGLGMGFDYPLLPWLSIDLSGVGYIPLDKIDNSSSYTFTQYVIGLNLDIIRHKK